MTFLDLIAGDVVFLDANTFVYHFAPDPFPRNQAMPLTVEAVYENGVLRPVQPLPLKEHERVQITIQSASNWVEETYGLCGWTGSAEEADRFATDPELDFPPPPEEP